MLRRIPTASSSASKRARCSARFVASRTMRIRSLVWTWSELIPEAFSQKSAGTHLRCRDDLSSSPFTLSSTFNDTRKIQNLDLRTAILQHTGNGSERSERVRGSLAPGLGDLGQERRFSDGRETDKCDTGIAALAHVEPCAATAGAAGGL